MDMTAFIQARSDQLNADDLMDSPRTITITKVTASPDAAEQPVTVHYEGDNGKPLKPCKTVRRIMVGVWGKDASKYVGRSMTLYRDPAVAFGGMQVGGIRVSHMSHIDEKKTVALMVTRGRKAPFTILPLAHAPAQSTDDPAERWTNAYIGKVQAATTLDEIAALENAQAARLTDLKGKRPELHERIAAAAEAKRGQLSPSDDLSAGFDEPGEGDRPTEPDPRTNDAATKPTAAEVSVDQVIDRARKATTSDELEAIIRDAEQHKAFLGEDLVMRLEIAFSQERARLTPAESLV